jgi:Plasmid replication region DNA-binding N-term
MSESTEPPLRHVPLTRGVRQADVSHAADALLRAGERPTVEKIRAAIGSGSPNTVGPLLDAWWKHLSARLDSGPAALHRLPETVAHVAEALWMQALDEGRRRAQLELKSTQRASAEQQQNFEVRSHVLTLREGELDARLHERERIINELNLQLRELTLLLRKEQAIRQAHSLRMQALEEQLLAQRRPLMPRRSKRPTNRRALRDKRTTRPQHIATRKARKKKVAEKVSRRGRR